MIVAALSFFVSLNDYIPFVERKLSARLKEPVSITSIKFATLPSPHVTVDGIKVADTEDIKLGKVIVTPALFSLLRSTRVIRSIEIDSLVLARKAIDKLPVWAKSDTAESPQVRVESIRVDNVVLRVDKANFGPFDVRVRLDSKGEPEDASMATQDGKFKALIKPENGRYLIDASAKGWALPVGPALVFDELIIKGMATQNDAELGEVSARLYGGTAVGQLAVTWEKGLQLDGNFVVSELELQHVSSLLSPGTHVSGKLTAKPVFCASAAADQIMKAWRLETPFNIQNGTLHGVDIQKAATNLIEQGTTSGETRCEHLSGHLVVQQGSHHLTQLKIVSGALAADGKVSVSPKKELSGRISVQVKAVGTSANVPSMLGEPDRPGAHEGPSHPKATGWTYGSNSGVHQQSRAAGQSDSDVARTHNQGNTPQGVTIKHGTV